MWSDWKAEGGVPGFDTAVPATAGPAAESR